MLVKELVDVLVLVVEVLMLVDMLVSVVEEFVTKGGTEVAVEFELVEMLVKAEEEEHVDDVKL